MSIGLASLPRYRLKAKLNVKEIHYRGYPCQDVEPNGEVRLDPNDIVGRDFIKLYTTGEQITDTPKLAKDK